MYKRVLLVTVILLLTMSNFAHAEGILPTMTSNTTPVPYKLIPYSEYNSVYKAYKAFDGDMSTRWRNLSTSGYIVVDLGSQKSVKLVQLYSSELTAPIVSIAGSNDNVSYETLPNSNSWSPASGLKLMEFDTTGFSKPFRYYKINCFNGNKPELYEVYLYDELPVPITPDGLICPSKPNNSVNLSWNSTLMTSYYKIYRDNVCIGTSNTTSFTDNTVNYHTVYKYQISAVNSSGESPLGMGLDLTTNYPPPIQWSFETDFYSANSVIQTDDGGYLATGSATVSGVRKLTCFKFDSSGNLLWFKTTDGDALAEGFFSVKETSDKGFVISNMIGRYAALIKLDKDGNQQWSKNYTNYPNSCAYSVLQTEDGGFIFSGETGNTYSPESGYANVLVVRTNSTGDLLWGKTFSGQKYATGRGIIPSLDGGYIIGGSTWTSNDNITRDVFLLKIDSAGNFAWQKYFGLPSNAEFGYSVCNTKEGGYLIGGTASGIAGQPGYRTYVIKTDSTGNMEWEKKHTGTVSEYCRSIQPTFDGGYIMAGHQFFTPPGATTYTFQASVKKLDSIGDVEWSETFPSLQHAQRAYYITQTNDSGYILSGFSNNFVIKLASDDAIAPSVKITSPTSQFTNDNTPLLIYAVSDRNPCTVTAKVYGQIVDTVSGQELEMLADGEYTVRVEAVDKAGNIGFDEVTFVVDTTKPIVKINSPANGLITNNNTPVLDFIINENNTETVKVIIDNNIVTKSSGETIESLSDGSHTVRVEATDKAGNTGFDEVTFIVDTVSPDVTANPIGGIYSATQSVTLTASEPGNIYYTLDGSDPILPGRLIYTQPILITNDATLKFYAEDLATNKSSVKTEIYFIDSILPMVTIYSPLDGEFIVNGNPTLTFTINEVNLDKVTVRVDGNIIDKGSGDILDSLSDGSHTVRVEAADKAGNTGFDEVTFTMGPPPDISCPYLYVPDGNDFVMENDIISVARTKFNEFTDYLFINKPISAAQNRIRLKVQEIMGEITKLDFLQLFVVNHPVGTKAGVDDKGQAHTYSNPISSVQAIFNGGNVTDEVYSEDGQGVLMYDHEIMELDFSALDLSQGAKLVLKVDGFERDTSIPNAIYKKVPAIEIQTEEDGIWSTKGKFFPKVNAALGVYDLKPYLDPANPKVRLISVSCRVDTGHIIDYVALDNSPDQCDAVLLSLETGLKNGTENVIDIINSPDGKYLTLSGETDFVDLEYSTINSEGLNDYFFVSKGYYDSIPTT